MIINQDILIAYPYHTGMLNVERLAGNKTANAKSRRKWRRQL